MAQNDQALLVRLKNSGLDFVIIGGVCVVYHGALLATFDLDICCPFGEQNIRRIETKAQTLAQAMAAELEAVVDELKEEKWDPAQG